jgi:transposase
MTTTTTYVGIDAHQKQLHVAMLRPGATGPEEWQVAHEPKAVQRLARKLLKEAGGEVLACYEAGPVGFSLQRRLEAAGLRCQVIAPALVPQRVGDRIKTDRRDARALARLLRAELLTEVYPPTPEQEAVRDLCRARVDLQKDRKRVQHRLLNMLARHGIGYGTGKPWTKQFWRWVVGVRFGHASAQAAFDDYLLAVQHAEERLRMLDERIEEVAQSGPYREAVGILRCFRGIETYTALALLSELGDISRFPTARHLMAYLGLTPSEHSSGERQRRGPITRTGNGHARRLLIESSWHQQHAPRIGVRLRARRAGQPGWAIAIADRAQQRLHRRLRHLVHHGKPLNKAVTAVAREFAAFLWSALVTLQHRRTEREGSITRATAV